MHFYVMWKDEKTAEVEISEDRKDVRITKYSDDISKMPFGGDKLDLERVYNFIEGRYFERGRPDIMERLEDIGLTEYNPWEIIKKTHGVMWEDYLWVKFDGEELTWEDVKARD